MQGLWLSPFRLSIPPPGVISQCPEPGLYSHTFRLCIDRPATSQDPSWLVLSSMSQCSAAHPSYSRQLAILLVEIFSRHSPPRIWASLHSGSTLSEETAGHPGSIREGIRSWTSQPVNRHLFQQQESQPSMAQALQAEAPGAHHEAMDPQVPCLLWLIPCSFQIHLLPINLLLCCRQVLCR